LTATPTSPWQTFADLLDPPENPYVRDPVGWVSDRLGEFMWSKQREIAESVVVNRSTAIKSAHDTGKSFTMSRLAAWWLDVHPTGEAFVVATAPTTAQVEAILWREIGKAHRKGNLPGRITLDAKWYMGQELVAYGRKPADYDQAAFQGIHAKYVLVLLDEAVGIPKSLFDAVDALATNVNTRVAAVANPDDPSSHFAQVCKPGSGWVVKRISAFDTHAYNGEKVPEELLALLVSPEWVEERKIRWGVTSPIYQSKVLGEFPDISDDTLILPKWIEAAQKRTLERTRRPIIAADIARFGEDETARAEDCWTLRERFEQGEIDIDPDDDKLAAQLGSIKWGIDSRGRIKIESKDDMRKRGLPSPDRADAMAIAFAGNAKCCTDQCRESRRREHYRGSDDKGW
jgi:hypothetical protein